MSPSTPTLELAIPKVYSMPAASPMFPSPPFKYQGCRQATVLFKTTAEALTRLVPAPLQPNPDQLIGVYYSLLTVREPAVTTYKEVGTLIPVVLGKIFGLYTAHMYLDTTVGIVCGREIWGFPKKEAEISFTEDGGAVATVVSRNGAPLIKASMRPEIAVKDIPPNPYQAMFTLKVIPSVKRDAPPDVLQLTSTPVVRQVAELHTGPATIELSSSPLDQLGDVPVLEVAGAQFEVFDMTLDYGEVAVDYLAPH